MINNKNSKKTYAFSTIKYKCFKCLFKKEQHKFCINIKINDEFTSSILSNIYIYIYEKTINIHQEIFEEIKKKQNSAKCYIFIKKKATSIRFQFFCFYQI